jgi:hypothetical protein
MRRSREGVFGAIAAAGVALAAIGAVHWTSTRSERAFPLYLELEASRSGGSRDQAGLEVALNGMSPEHLTDLARALDDLADELEVERNPFVEELDDDDAQKKVATLIATHLPSLTAGASLAEGAWSSADHALTVRVTARCAPGARCFPLESRRERDPIEQRARFLAWCMADAALLRAHSESEAVRVATALRERASDRSRIALVLRDGDLHGLRWSVEVGRLALSLQRVTRLVPSDDDSALARLVRKLARPKGGGGGDDDPVPWLHLPEGTILVVPRLSALATLSEFVAEVKGRLESAGVGVDWVYLPR